MLSQNSTSLTVSENSLATTIGIAAPVDSSYASAALTVLVTALPTDGTILLADGITPITLGQSLTANQLTALKFRPGLNAFGTSSTFGFTISDPAGSTAPATATVTIGASNTPLVTNPALLDVPQHSAATLINIQAPTDASFTSSQLTITIIALPTDGTVTLANGASVTAGETLTVAQLTGLEFIPTANASGATSTISNLTYRVSDPAAHNITGTVILQVDPDTPPITTPQSLTVAENSGATPINIAAPTDANFAASALSVRVTALPTDGRVVLSNGTTSVTVGESLTVAQLTGLEFAPSNGAFTQSSAFTYSVSDPTGASASGSATLNIGPNNTPLVTTPTSLTVDENSGATAIGIQAPSDASFASSALGVTVTGLPTDGTVLLANGSTPVTVGESLTVAQLTGLMFKPAQDSTGQSSTFSYSVSDPGGHSANGSATLKTGANPIVLENELPGTPMSVWQIAPGQDSSELQGYVTSISTNVGGTVDFKVDNTTGNGTYQIDIYRLGYYGGDGARLVDTIQHNSSTAIVQPNAITDPSTGLVDAGDWSVTDSWNVGSNAVSGVYVANIVQGNVNDPTQIFQIPFIVKDTSSDSDIVFQTSDETWEAYNGWGGANLYGGDGPAPISVGGSGLGAAYAVSYNRPLTTFDSSGAESGVQDTVFGAEYSAIYWLEENGYDVSYISGMDTATDGALLLNHKIFMDAGHDEYWTDSQVANVQAAANAGVNLAFMSGNEMFWQTELLNSIDGSNTPNRTLETYKDSHFESIVNPSGVGTGSFEAPTNLGGAGLPSNAVTGTMFQVDENTLGVESITVPYGESLLRIWRNTSVANTAPGGTATLAADLLGYEWDSSPDNGFEPVGLVDLSSTTIVNGPGYNTEFGNVDTTGTATHNLVEYRDPTSGALVFGAGTVFWSWGLADESYGTAWQTLPADPSVEQATVNLFADMGVQPSTLQATLKIATASTDHTPPKSTISSVSTTSPVEGQSVTVTGSATDSGGGVIATVDVSTDGGNTWHPATTAVGAVTENWSYTFNAPAPGTHTIESRAVDDSLNIETPGPGVSYTAAPSTALSLFSPSDTPAVADAADTTAVEVGLKFTSSTNGYITGIRFYKGPLNTGTHLVDLWSSTGALLASAPSINETASGWQQVNFSTPVKISAGQTYIASYHTVAGEYSDTPYYFDTLQDPTNGSLSAISDGLNGVFGISSNSIFPTNVSVSGDNYWVDVVFNDQSVGPQANNVSGLATTENTTLAIPASTLLANDTDSNGLSLSVSGVSDPVNGTVSYNAATQTVSFVPTSNFVGEAGFTYTISDGQNSASGNVLVTINNPPTAQTLFSASATPGTINVNDPNAVNLGVEFQASTNGTISGIRFYKGPDNTGTHVADLWTSTGTLLASATFTDESASGWQQVNFSNPVSITAGTTYIASYYTSSGDYSIDTNYFNTAVTSGSLTALASGTSGGDGVFAYGGSPAFPTNGSSGSNYWVDVVFNGITGPAANNVSGLVAFENTALSISASTLLSHDTDPNGLPLSISGVSSPSDGTVSYNANTQTINFVPNANYVGPASFTYTITDGQSSASGNVSINVNNPLSAQTLFSASATPGTITVDDAEAVTLGVKFQASAYGTISGIRFYKGPENTGTHVADLWSSTGVLLASATSSNESASGWQQVNFSTPVSITAGTTYIASYYTSSGDYSADANYFTNAVTTGSLTALASGTSGGDGVYAYGAVFPTNSFNASNYWVDVVYNQSAVQPPVASTVSVATTENTTLPISASTLLANDTDPNGLPLSVSGVSSPINGTVSYNATTQTVSFVPISNYVGPASFTYTITDGQVSGSGNVSINVTNPATAQTLFSASATPGTITASDPSSVTLGVKFEASANGTISGIRFYKGPSNTGTHVADLWSSTGTLLASATFTSESASGWQQVNFSTPVSITAGTTYIASYYTSSGDYSVDANYFNTALTSGSLTALASGTSGGDGLYAYGSSAMFPTNSFGASNYWVDVVFNPSSIQPPVANNDSGLDATENTALSIPASALLSNDTDPNGLLLSISGVSNPSNGTVSYNASTQAITFVPATNYVGPASFTYTITDGQASASGNVSLTVNNPTMVQTLFAANATPGTITVNDPEAVTLGVKFQASADGVISGIRFYKGPENTGTHVADLWSSSGTLLASATFTNESASGWQQVNFSAPVAVAAGTTYIASYYTSSGEYSVDANYFTNAVTSGPLTALASGTNGGDGVYTYGSSPLFPTNSFNASNYWVDVDFIQPSNQPPIAQNVNGLADTTNTTLSIPVSTLLANDSDPSGLPLSISGVSNPSGGTVSYNAATQTLSFVPSANYTGPAGFTYTVTDGLNSTSANVGLTVSDASLFNQAYTPSTVTVSDNNASLGLELGVKIQPSENGTITGIEFYKGPQNTGTHVADLWTTNGTLLATATFTNETASGWQQVNFATPVAVTAGTTYIASYHTFSDYSATPNFFATALTNGLLTAPASSTSGGNGVYTYYEDPIFPANSFNATNYGVDALFRPQLAS
jgi:hypothetical protein